MRTVLRCAAFAVVALTLVACDTEQPAQGGGVDAILAIDTAPVPVADVDTWEIWEDITFPRDGVPDRPARVTQPNGAITHRCDVLPSLQLARYPWAFSVEVSVLRKGTTRAEVLTNTYGQTDRYTAVTRFIEEDANQAPLADFDNDPTGPGDTVYATEYYRNGLRVSLANPAYASRCAGENFEANIGALDNPATISLNPGDTLIVQARKAPQNSNPVLGGIFPVPVLTGTLLVGGRPVSVRGTAQSTDADGDGISFSYTLN